MSIKKTNKEIISFERAKEIAISDMNIPKGIRNQLESLITRKMNKLLIEGKLKTI